MKISLLKEENLSEAIELLRIGLLNSLGLSEVEKQAYLIYFENILKSKDHHYLKLQATEFKKLIGILIASESAGVKYLEWVCVHPEHRRNSVATKLIKTLEREAKKKGNHKVYLTVKPENRPAINLYQKLDYFQEAYLKRQWYKGDYVLMSKFLF